VADVRVHVREHSQFDTIGFNRAFLQSTDAFVVAGCQGKVNFLAHEAYLACLPYPAKQLNYVHELVVLAGDWDRNLAIANRDREDQ
jgi:hypothetical protein